MGRAADLIQLRPQHQQLRHIFHMLFGGCLVFDTYDNGLEYRRVALEQSVKVPLIVTMDGERLETTGIVYAGRTKQRSKFRYTRGPQ